VRGGLTRRVMLASTALVVLIGGAFAVLLLAVDSMRDSGALARHSRVELSAADRLEKHVVDLETGQRGFVITHDPRFLAPWRVARSAVPVAGRRLLTLAGDRGDDPQASRLVRAVRSYMRNYSLPLVAAARRGDPDVESVGATLRGKRLVDSLRARFNRYVSTQRDLLTSRQAEADAEAHRATVAASAGLVGSIVLIVMFASYLARAILVPIRRVAGMARQIAGGELSVRMPETGLGEVGLLEGTFNKMAGSLDESQAELRRHGEQQAALRRVATLVARDVPPEELLDSVAREVAGVLAADTTGLLRYEPDGDLTLLAAWTRLDVGFPFPARLTPPAGSLNEQILATGRPASSEFDDNDESEAAALYRRYGLRSTLGVPIFVGGRLWGLMVAAWAGERLEPEVVEPRLSEFTELVATAIANAESRAELAASRARVVAAADQTRRRIERNLHDGTQQRLISVGLQLRAAEALASPDQAELRARISDAALGLTGAVAELQEISRGIHPAILSRGGLREALKALARRSSVPVELHAAVDGELPEQVEVATYYLVSEALTNAAKHARASVLQVDAETDDGVVRLSITDDGVGGADPDAGSGLVGLKDRVEALGGDLRISSAPGHGTALRATIPIEHGDPR
jgi:signal transduction histidine kinase